MSKPTPFELAVDLTNDFKEVNMKQTNATHTKGPWRVEQIAAPKLSIYSDSGSQVAIIPDNPRAQFKANAQLIAAAPELLDALKAAIRCLAVAVNNDAFKDCALPNIGEHTLRQAESAIVKAEGK